MPEQPKNPIKLMWTGCLWFVVGGAVIMVVHMLRTSSSDPLERWGPLVPMFAGAYCIVVGIEKMFSGFKTARASGEPRIARGAMRTLIICGVIVLSILGAGAATYMKRSPYWDAIKERDAGETAFQELRAISEKHAVDLGASPEGPAALEVWRSTSSKGRVLKPAFVTALEATKYLASVETGKKKFRAELDGKFYNLCAQWADLYERIHNQIENTSIEAPPDDWAIDYDDVIERMQALIEPEGGEGHEGHDHGQGEPEAPPAQPEQQPPSNP